jgi:DNA invertase Pin-like site-specific DNA recombinase
LIYARKSVVKNKRDEVSPERQVTMCAEAARLHDWTAETFVDAEGHRSGGSEKHRPEWRRLKAQLSRPDVAAVIVADITRASRSPRDFYNFLDECNKRGVQFISLKQAIDTTTANGRAMLGMSLIFAAWEREIASERALTAINFKHDAGKHVGNAPFGTKRDEAGVLVESEDWPTCQTVFETYATGSHSFYSLAVYLNARALRFRNRQHEAVPFNRSAVRSIISNVLTYPGYIVRGHGKEMMLPSSMDDTGNVVDALAEYVGAIKGLHAPLISHEMATRIILARKAMSQLRGDLERRVYILRPILYCAACGSPMRAIRMGGLARYIHLGKVCVRRATVLDADEVERRALANLGMMKLPAQEREELRRRIEARVQNAPELAEVMAAIRNLEAKQEMLRELYIEGDIGKEQFDRQRRATRIALDELQTKTGAQTISLDAVFEQLDSLAAILAAGTPLQQRRALADLFERIEVDFRGNIGKMIPQDWVCVVFQSFNGEFAPTM